MNQTTGWHPIPCRTCGIALLPDCPDRFPRAERFVCSCDDGCQDCDWLGYYLKTVGGHQWAVRLPREITDA